MIQLKGKGKIRTQHSRIFNTVPAHPVVTIKYTHTGNESGYGGATYARHGPTDTHRIFVPNFGSRMHHYQSLKHLKP